MLHKRTGCPAKPGTARVRLGLLEIDVERNGDLQMPAPAWWMNLTWKVPVIRAYRMAAQSARQLRNSESSFVVGGLPEGTEIQVSVTNEEMTGYLFPSRESFEHFAEAVQALIPDIPLNFAGDQGPFDEQLDRYFASVVGKRRRLTLLAQSPGLNQRIGITTTADFSASPTSLAKTLVEVMTISSDENHSRQVANGIAVAFQDYADPRPSRGRTSKAAVIQPMDVHSRELEAFKTSQNRRTVWISAAVSLGVALLTIGSRIFLP